MEIIKTSKKITWLILPFLFSCGLESQTQRKIEKEPPNFFKNF